LTVLDAPVVVLQVLEETGYDIEELVCEDDFIELNLDGKRNKLYIVAGLDPDSAQFAPKCKGVSICDCGDARAAEIHVR
jgi:mRNA-decapping enzyme subunit 2